MYDRHFGNDSFYMNFFAFPWFQLCSIDQEYCLQAQINTNQQNFTKVAVDNLMEKKLFISLIRLCDKTAVKCSDVRKRKVA